MNITPKHVFTCIIIIILVGIAIFIGIYSSRIKTIQSIEKLTDYNDNYDIYRMDIQYDYSIDRVLDYGITDNQSFIDSIVKESLPILPIHMEAPDFGCSAFTLNASNGEVMMGRNYDFRYNTSAMLVYCTPSDGYRSVAFAALDNLSANDADANIKSKLSCLLAPFVCLDGMNEKGVSIAVLTLDSEPTNQDTGKTKICTSLAIRLVLDKAATTEEAVELLKQYDMFASSGRDYHFYITDASGDGRIIEYDCDSEARELVATPTRTTTNFFIMHMDKVTEYGKNGIYGHGKDRYDKIEAVFDSSDTYDVTTAWDALKAASQLPNPESITSNTQWSIVFNNTTLETQIVLHRNWDSIVSYDLNTNSIKAE